MFATMLVADLPNEILTIYSRDAMFAAMPQLYFRNFVEVKSEFREPGETVQFLKINNLPLGGQLANETTPIPKQKYTDSIVQITVKEYANAVQFSKRAMEASFRNLMQDASNLLGRDYGLVMDKVCRDAFLATANKQYMATASSEGINDAAVTAAGKLTTYAIKNAVETLKTMNAPLVQRGGDQTYICVAHPHQLRGLRDDSAWIEAHKYVTPDRMYNGECGRYENVVFLETTQMPILTGVGDDGIDVYQCAIFGAGTVGFGETVPFGLVNDGIEDFGRLVSIGWYSIFGAGIINDYIIDIHTA